MKQHPVAVIGAAETATSAAIAEAIAATGGGIATNIFRVLLLWQTVLEFALLWYTREGWSDIHRGHLMMVLSAGLLWRGVFFSRFSFVSSCFVFLVSHGVYYLSLIHI